MTLREFSPSGVTGCGDEKDMLFRSQVTGPQGVHYELLKEKHHTAEQIKEAKDWLRRNYDVVSIHIINETE
jgi:hypothetical protein